MDLNNTEQKFSKLALGVWLAMAFAIILAINFIGPGLSSSSNFHTVLEFFMTIFAAMIGGMSFIRYFTRKQSLFLFLGIGFLGTSALDAYTALATTETFLHFVPSELNTFFVWSWTAQSLFLAFFLGLHLISGAGTRRVSKFIEIFVSAMGVMIILGFYGALTIITLPEISIQFKNFNRAEDLFASATYGLILLGLISKGRWQHIEFESWLIISLIFSTAAHTFFMPFSAELYDASFMSAHLIKTVAYLLVLFALLSNVYGVYKSARNNESRIRAIVESSIDGLITVNWQREMTSFNSAAENIFRLSNHQTRGASIRTLIAPEDYKVFEIFWQSIQQDLAVEAKETSEFIGVRTGQDTFNLELGVTKLPNSQQGEGYLVRARDITERKTNEETIYRQANFDTLTGLPNRMMFNERLANEISRCKREGGLVGVMFLDLDGFKKINDTMGHGAGDQLLIEAGKRIKSSVREVDIVARLGGDEFTVILHNIHKRHDSEVVAQKIIKALTQPYIIDGIEVVVTGSIGITLYPQDADDQESIVKNADAAMYKAKSAGKNVYRFFTPEMNEEALKALEIENGIRKALRDEEFKLYYQPIVDTKSGAVIGAEALIRWIHPEQGVIAPDEFIPICEETGAINEVV